MGTNQFDSTTAH